MGGGGGRSSDSSASQSHPTMDNAVLDVSDFFGAGGREEQDSRYWTFCVPGRRLREQKTLT